jgi:thiol-disulfide isomerase/thioredoxin
MLRLVAGLLVSLSPAALLGQSLTEVAKKEKQRRKSNEQKGVPVRTITEDDIAATTVTPSSTEADSNEGEEDQTESFQLVLKGPPAPAPATQTPNLGPAPNFDLPDRRGKYLSLKRLRGKTVLIDFWATWCAPCRATMPEVENLYRKYRAQGLEVIGINIEGKNKKVLEYLDENRFSFTILFDSGDWDAVAAKAFNVSSIPRTFLIDKQGIIVYSGMPNRLPASLIEATLK